MQVNVRFDANDNIEKIDEKNFSLGTNLINFISLDMENILNTEVISNLSKSNYQKIISNINKATKSLIIPEIIDINVLIDTAGQTVNIQQIKKDLTQILNTYIKFKEIIEFCYFNDNLKTLTPLKKYIYYLHTSKTKDIILPKQIISSFSLKSNKTLKDNNIIAMLEKNSPYLYFSYQCLNINDYMTVTFLQLIENNYLILKCKNCNKYFIPYKRTDTYYCDRISPQDNTKTCKKYAIELAWREKTKDETDWHCLYRRVYQSLQMKSKRKPNDALLKKFFEDFKIEAKEWKKAVKEGAKTEKEFMSWLQEFRQ